MIREKIIYALIFILSVPVSAWSQSVGTRYGDNPQAGKFIDLRGFRMYYETYGSGEPLLLIHGNSQSIEAFHLQIPFFESRFRVIAVDTRAHGKSADGGDSLSYEMMADDFGALLDILRIDSCYVIGWSDGGINGLLLAMRRPEKVKKLAISGANLRPDKTAVDPYIRDWALHYNDSLSRLPSTPEVRQLKKLGHLLSYEPQITTQQLSQIKAPTLVIAGDYDVILPQHTLEIAQAIPRSYLWIRPGSGHSIPVIHPEEFNRHIFDFFTAPFRKIEKMDRLH